MLKINSSPALIRTAGHPGARTGSAQTRSLRGSQSHNAMIKNKITQILENDVSWYVNGLAEKLDETTIQHIIDEIIGGCSQGEICMTLENGGETTGWWHIIHWRSIACGLYHNLKACKKLTDPQQTAIDKFDEEWTF